MKIHPSQTIDRHQETYMVSQTNIQARKEKNNLTKTALEENPALAEIEIESTLQQLNQEVEAFNIGFRFKLHEESNRYMFLVVDLITNEVIKEIPPQKMLDLAAQIDRLVGLLLDDKR